MTQLANGLLEANHYEEALSVKEGHLSTLRRIGAPEESILIVQNNLAITYSNLGRHEEALRLRREVYSGRLKLDGKEHENTLIAANNYAESLLILHRVKEAKKLMRRTMLVARRVLGEDDDTTLRARCGYAMALYKDDGATLDDLHKAVTTLEEIERIARRVFGGAHPLTKGIDISLRNARAALHARETVETP